MPAAPLWGLAMFSLVAGFALGLAWRGWALRRGVVDAPDERRLHVVVGVEQNLRLTVSGCSSGNHCRRTRLSVD